MPTNNHSDNLFDGQPPLDDEQLWDLLSLYVDGEADPTQAAIVERMLSSDPAYRRDFDFMMETSQTMHMVDEVEPPVSLREAVYVRTTGRTTLVSRLRTAWNRATTPAFGRYATVAGAFAVAALGAVIAGPHLGSSHPSGAGPAQVAEVTPRSDTPSVAMPRLGLLDFELIKPSTMLVPKPSAPKAVVHNNSMPPDKPNIVPDPQKALPKIGPRIAVGTHSLRNYPLLKKSGSHSDGTPQVAANGTSPGGYPYNPNMDLDATHNQPKTIVSQKNDFGPEVAIDDTPTTVPSAVSKTIAMAQKPDGNVTPQPTPDAPKARIRTVALPPADKQVLAEAVLRKNMNPRMDSYDHSLADNSQQTRSLTLYKSTF